jgi:uncharacterized cofD-like protein
MLRGFRAAAPQAHLTAIVAVTDEGRSSGPIRAAFGLPAPGDLRNALLALATPATVHDAGWANLFGQRLAQARGAPWEGMAVGNVLLAALAEQAGDFLAGVATAAHLLNVRGAVLPVTGASAHLAAELADGREVRGELAVRAVGKPRIRRVFLAEGTVAANPAALEAVAAADLVVLGPGSLYTSLLACLVCDGLPAALRDSPARRVYISNTTTQPGQSDGYTLTDHVAAVLDHGGPGVLDGVLVNTAAPPPAQAAPLAAAGVHPVLPSPGELDALAARWDLTVLPGAWLAPPPPPDSPELWNKVATAPHAAEPVARALLARIQPAAYDS